ncbi:MAG: hypothetical protein AAF654_05675, partial [Myxococcota bacterium]
MSFEQSRITEKSGDSRTFPCESCGADLEFNIGVQSLKCPFCGFEKALELSEDDIVEQDLQTALTRLQTGHDAATAPTDAEQLNCSSCGAKILFEGVVTSTECPYCGTPVQRGDVHRAEDRVKVDGMLPFMVEKTNAKEKIRHWVRTRWFAPNEFKRRGVSGQFEGVYLPYFTFDAMTFTVYRGQRGDYYYVEVGSGDNKRRERRTRWSSASGRFQRFFDDVLICCARAVETKLVHALEPWPLPTLKPFDHQMIAGHKAMTYDIELADAFTMAQEEIDSSLQADVRGRIGGDVQRVSALNTDYSALTYKHLLLPVYILAYRYKEKSHRVFVNACTGEVQGQRPWSWV